MIYIEFEVYEQANPVYIHTEIFACWEESQTLKFNKKGASKWLTEKEKIKSSSA